MVVNNNVFILLEEIENMLGSMKSKLEEVPKVINEQQPTANDPTVLFPIRVNIRDIGWLH